MNEHEIGIIGLGTMGRNLALNMAARGFGVAGYDLASAQAERFRAEATEHRVIATTDLPVFVASLARPRAIILLVPQGAPVDGSIERLRPMLDAADIVIDSGNSHFADTERRITATTGALSFTGMGISGGEAGARNGASLMFGGSPEMYERVRPMLETVAARVGDDPCVARVGARSAGHYVKMVHNGIEYGVMQLLAECYDVMRRGLGMELPDIAEEFARWNDGRTAAYLVEITAAVLGKTDDVTGRPLVDVIVDSARQKGTGRWTSQEAMTYGVPITAIDAAVGARDLSAWREQRIHAATIIGGPDGRIVSDGEAVRASLREAFYDAMVITYAQGMSLLGVANAEHAFGLDLELVARIWRGGCIIRAALLEIIRDVYRDGADVTNPLVAPRLAAEVAEGQGALRRVIAASVTAGIPVPALSSALAYFDGYRSARLPANLIQAQRDFFGAHGFERQLTIDN